MTTYLYQLSLGYNKTSEAYISKKENIHLSSVSMDWAIVLHIWTNSARLG